MELFIIHIELNKLVYETVHTIASLPIKEYLSAIIVTSIFRSFTYRMAAKKTGIDTERNYVTATLCIAVVQFTPPRQTRHRPDCFVVFGGRCDYWVSEVLKNRTAGECEKFPAFRQCFARQVE